MVHTKELNNVYDDNQRLTRRDDFVQLATNCREANDSASRKNVVRFQNLVNRVDHRHRQLGQRHNVEICDDFKTWWTMTNTRQASDDFKTWFGRDVL